MPDTTRLYYEDPSMLGCDALVIDVRDSGSGADIVLDRTAFYPEGGGQPCDLGSLGGLPLLKVFEEDSLVIHRVEGRPSFSAGDRVAMEVDARRRRDHSQQHSGQHLLSAVLEREHGIHTLGFHLGTAYCTIDVSRERMDASLIEELESKADAFIARDCHYRVHVCPPEDPSSFPLRKKLPQGEDLIRIVEIEAYDWVACCGTHVESASELRALTILYTERYKGNSRIYFMAGDRAVALLRRHHSLLRESALALGTSEEETPGRISSLLLRGGTLEGERAALMEERAGMEIELALAASRAEAGTIPAEWPLRFSYRDRSAEAAFETAKAGASRGLAVVAVSIPDRTVCLMTPAAAAKQGSIALGTLLKPLLQEKGGKGGGGPNSFRAVFETAQAAEDFAAAAGALLA